MFDILSNRYYILSNEHTTHSRGHAVRTEARVLEVEARPALELLIGLSAATSPKERHDESWLPARADVVT